MAKDRKESMLIFSQSIKTLNIIESLCHKFNERTETIQVLRVDGSCPPEDRNQKIKLFQNSKIPSVFILSTKACCEAINLTAATRVILFDANWNPCHDEQAICRAYRIGQKNKVHIYRFVAQGTMEERVLVRQAGKKSMSDRVVNNDKKLTKEKRNAMNQLYLYEEIDKKPPEVEDIKQAIGNADINFARIAINFSPFLAKVPEEVKQWFVNDNTRPMNEDEKRAAMKNYESHEKLDFNSNAISVNRHKGPDSDNQAVRVTVPALELIFLGF